MQCTIVSQRVEQQLESEPSGDPGGGMNQTGDQQAVKAT